MDCIGNAVTSRRGPQSGRWHRSYKIHSSIKYGLHLDAVTPRRGPQSGRCHRSYKIHLSTKYGLHWDAVISRCAREHANEVGALDVTKKKTTYTNISQFLFTFHQIPCKLGEHHKTSLGLRWSTHF